MTGLAETGLAERVTAALERSVRPSVIARGAAIRVAGIEGGVVTLEVTGSPGAVFPLAARIEAAVRTAVPEITGVRLAAPAALPGAPPAASGAGPAVPGNGPTAADSGPAVPGAGPAVSDSGPDASGGGRGEAAHIGDDLAEAAQRILDAEVNPAIAAHRGHVTVAAGTDGWLRISLDGGCQGCSLAEVTLRQGIEPLLRARLPGLTGLADVTDHEAGTKPFFSPEKR